MGQKKSSALLRQENSRRAEQQQASASEKRPGCYVASITRSQGHVISGDVLEEILEVGLVVAVEPERCHPKTEPSATLTREGLGGPRQAGRPWPGKVRGGRALGWQAGGAGVGSWEGVRRRERGRVPRDGSICASDIFSGMRQWKDEQLVLRRIGWYACVTCGSR